MTSVPPGTGARRSARRGRLAVLLIVGLGAVGATAKIILEAGVAREARERVAALDEALGGLDPAPLLAEDHRALRELLAKRGEYGWFIHYRDRAIPLLEEAFRNERGRERPAHRAAWLIILLKIDSPRSREFFEEAVPSLMERDLRREAEAYLARQASRG